jgi:hypothetical protein
VLQKYWLVNVIQKIQYFGIIFNMNFNNRKEKGFVSLVILIVIALITLRYAFHIDVVSFITKYFNKDALKAFDQKAVYYYKAVGEKIIDLYFTYIHPHISRFLF